VVSDGPCGPIVRWQAIAERWEESEHCGPDLAVTTSTSFHQWFGVPDTGVTVCTSPIFPPAGEAEWTTVCPDTDTTSTDRAAVVGVETLVIGGESVDTIHIRIMGTTEGSTVGTTTTDLWRLPGTVLVVREQVDDSSSNATRIGEVHYVEQVTLQLRSLIPTG
jgi:hypothetical protein